MAKKYSKIGLCHGCFDLLHYGHILHFLEAKNFCDFLVVSLTSDKYINKGVGRPIFNQNERKGIIESLRPVDKVIISNNSTGIDSLRKISPSIYFKGNDYKETNDKRFSLELEICKEIGCEIFITKSIKYSTTEFITKCQKVNLKKDF